MSNVIKLSHFADSVLKKLITLIGEHSMYPTVSLDGPTAKSPVVHIVNVEGHPDISSINLLRASDEVEINQIRSALNLPAACIRMIWK